MTLKKKKISVSTTRISKMKIDAYLVTKKHKKRHGDMNTTSR